MEIRPGEVRTMASGADKVAAKLTSAHTEAGVASQSDALVGSMNGWTSAQKLGGVSVQWANKTKALVSGPSGFDAYADALRGLATAVDAEDEAGASKLKATMDDFSEPYAPAHTAADARRLAQADLDRKLGAHSS